MNVSSDFVDVDRTDLEQQIYQTASSRLDAVAPLGHLCSCSNRSPTILPFSIGSSFLLCTLPHPLRLCTTILTIHAHHSRFESCPRRHSEALLPKSDCISRTASLLEGYHQSPRLCTREALDLF